MNILNTPNLPRNRVTHLLISCDATQAIETLKTLSITSITAPRCVLFDTPVQSHPDMMFLHAGKDKCFVQASQEELVKTLTNVKLSVTLTQNDYNGVYPNDVGLNCAFIGNYLIGRVESMDKSLIEYCEEENIELINVKQGYSKCSICIVDENSIITEDESIYQALNNKLDVLKIDSGSVILGGYNYGFFGGCTGLINKNLLAVNGEIKFHANYKEITAFLNERDIEIISLKSGPLKDIGSIIPLIEE